MTNAERSGTVLVTLKHQSASANSRRSNALYAGHGKIIDIDKAAATFPRTLVLQSISLVVGTRPVT